MHHHRKLKIAGRALALVTVALLLLLGSHAFGSDHPPLTARFALATTVALLTGATSIRLLGDASAVQRIERRTSGHVEGVRETVDRLAAALPKEPSSYRR